MPVGLYGRAALIILAPIVLLQLVVSLVFIQRYYEDVTQQMVEGVILELNFLLDETNTADTLTGANANIAKLVGPLALNVSLPAADDQVADAHRLLDLSGRVVIQTIHERIARVIAVDVRSNKRRVRIWIDTDHGPMFVSLSRRRVSASNPHQFLVLIVFVGAILSILSYVFLRNQMRPIRRLAAAADAFGKGRVVSYTPSGAIEVRLAGNAFLDMRRRIERQIEQRTTMLSGVSHDLRTPLTRLKLGLSMLDDTEDSRDLLDDVNDMERLLEEFLSFARGDALDDIVKCDPVELVGKIVHKVAKSGGAVSLQTVQGQGLIKLRPIAVTRAVENLISNALRYGHKSHVSILVSGRFVRITVEDDGPGIPPDSRAEALKPFVRLDAARNQNRGAGVGLGLSIAHDIALHHGGALQLGESEALGGLKVDLVLLR